TASGPRVVRSGHNPDATDKTPPLPEAELAQVLTTYDSLRKRRPEWLRDNILANVSKELRRARRQHDEEALYRTAVDSASQREALASVLHLAARRGDVDSVLALLDRVERLPVAKKYGSS